MSSMICKDVDGRTVVIDSSEISRLVKEDGFSAFGMNLNTISELRKDYLKRGGEIPIAKEGIERLSKL